MTKSGRYYADMDVVREGYADDKDHGVPKPYADDEAGTRHGRDGSTLRLAGSNPGVVRVPIPRIAVDSPDDQIACIESPDSYPEGEFLAIAAWPCPVGRWARGGVGGQTFTSCSMCGHMSPSTAQERHDGPVLTPVVAYTSTVGGRPVVAFRRATVDDLGGAS